MELAPHIPIERCRLVEYNIKDKVMDQSFDLDEFQHQTIGQIAGGARVHSSFKLFLETCKENETFKKYSHGGINLEVSVVDLSTGEVGPVKPVRGEEGWTVGELKQHIGELFNISSSCMRIVLNEKDYQGDLTQDISHVRSTLKTILSRGYRQYEKVLLMRLRDKNGVSPGTVYPDHERIVDARTDDARFHLARIYDIGSTTRRIDDTYNKEIHVYVEPLKGPEKKKDIVERQLSKLSGVPAEYIYYSEGLSFPVEISCLDIEKKLNWYSITSDRYPLRLYDGYVLYYKY
ncbi:PREDICTED: uncharacterized protein LOC109587112 [Amphimedon queenslandica]|uniref:Ubiquitin carboxyl-terminal hydrolase 47 C-terminal domain-containing protein n=1 Tax=Amphimedon queenslandica TaxID=400682 RepID=A0AAN0JQ18_AMPQE|nr:PREDICTED: uncharacterized protein LOC109587112 [Amphimedon queenslandica]|eukprot:XP_019858898.1 PREDICTED: uncharacterized protein LOC109587112 [Amphimedon queenslandica]